MKAKSKIEINAILDTELEDILKTTPQYPDLVEGKILCKSCNTVITSANIGIIIPVKGSDGKVLEFYCEKIDCTEKIKQNHD